MKPKYSFSSLLARLSRPAAALLLAGSLGSVMAGPIKIETINVAPFGFLGADGKPTGIWFEIGNLVTQEAGLPSENVLTPYARTVQDLTDGTADIVIRFSNEQLEKSAIPVGHIVPLPTVVVSLKGSSFKGTADLRGKTIGILRGGLYGADFSGDELIKKFEASDYNQEISMLSAQRLDGAAGTAIGLYYEANKHGLSKEQMGEQLVLGTQDIILLFSKKNADDKTVAALKAAIDKLQKEDAFAKVISKYMGDFKWAATDSK
jgi:ABC-type amino acid transport substrate-binding protein